MEHFYAQHPHDFIIYMLDKFCVKNYTQVEVVLSFFANSCCAKFSAISKITREHTKETSVVVYGEIFIYTVRTVRYHIVVYEHSTCYTSFFGNDLKS